MTARVNAFRTQDPSSWRAWACQASGQDEMGDPSGRGHAAEERNLPALEERAPAPAPRKRISLKFPLSHPSSLLLAPKNFVPVASGSGFVGEFVANLRPQPPRERAQGEGIWSHSGGLFPKLASPQRVDGPLTLTESPQSRARGSSGGTQEGDGSLLGEQGYGGERGREA